MSSQHPMFAPFGAGWPAFRAFLTDLIYPEGAFCRACGRISGGEILCPACRGALQNDGLLFRWEAEALEPDLTAYSMTPHTGIARALVLRLKHHGEACVARSLGDLLLPLPKDFSFSPDTVVTWVTMPENRRRERMIDHGCLLAEEAARRLDLPCRQLLIRRETKEKNQASLNRTARQENLKNAFLPLEKISFPVLLVDDVLTTGTTARRCAEALRSGGAERITVLTYTRALRT